MDFLGMDCAIAAAGAHAGRSGAGTKEYRNGDGRAPLPV